MRDRIVRMPDGTQKWVKDDGSRHEIKIGAGGFGVCPVCEMSLRLPDPTEDLEGKGLCSCPICKATLSVRILR